MAKTYKRGGNITVYIPLNASDEALKWINSQEKLSTSVFNLVDNHVKRIYGINQDDIDMIINDNIENLKYKKGSRFNIRIPIDVDNITLSWINAQKKISTSIFEVIELYVKIQKKNTFNK